MWKRYEYSFVPDNVDVWLIDEAVDFGEVMARDMREARELAWTALPYGFTLRGVREVK